MTASTLGDVHGATLEHDNQDTHIRAPLWRQESLRPETKSFRAWLGRAKAILFGHKESKPANAEAAASGGVAARKDFPWLIVGGSCLCYIAGWVNAFGMIAALTSVSHVTGSTTRAGMSLSSGNHGYIVFAFGIWSCFVLGGAVSGIIIYHPSFALGRSYGHVLLLISLVLLWASCWAVVYPDDRNFAFLLALGMGMQNGLTTSFSGNVVRTTHLTGLSTDIGITLGHVLRCHPKPDRWKLKMYIPMLVAFFSGAASSWSSYMRCGQAAIFFPTFMLMFLGLSYILCLSRMRKQPFHKVLLHRVSNEIMSPHSPIGRRAFKALHLDLIHLPHMHHKHAGTEAEDAHALREEIEPPPSIRRPQINLSKRLDVEANSI